MLKRLELAGFKSFADKTVFEFGNGITAIVGPNGSGKSNIIDSVRWVLGEQSAKSLRGGEMADVIFNGSASRRSLGLAEVSLVLDNSRRQFNADAEEVQVTRRVYRGGEGEYLINGRACRLKDVKDLFLGSGAGADAYCIIEQGRVDVLLQSSTRERRTIFEEAAGISRFKARKTEALRKLERVDQNVQRLRDIIDEVEKQLRSVKLQAAKAQRYQEYSARLKELRVTLGLQEYHDLSGKLAEETSALDRLRTGLDERSVQALAWEERVRALEDAMARLDEELRRQEARLAAAREQIKAGETTLGHESALSADLEVELGRARGLLHESGARLAALAEAAAGAGEELRGAEAGAEQQRGRVSALEAELQQTVGRLAELQQQVQADKAEHLEQMRQTARLQNDAVSYQAQVENLTRERSRLRHKTEQAAESLASLDLELQQLAAAEASLQAKLAAARQGLAELRQEGERLRKLRDETGEIVSRLRQQRSGLASRIEVLEGLERSHEGLGTGVREVLDLLGAEADGDKNGPWRRAVVGMIADFLEVRREYAPLVDLALGEWSQRFVARDASLLAEALAARPQPFSGRVSFVPLSERREEGPRRAANRRRNRLIEVSPLGQVRMPRSAAGVPAHPGVVAPADQLVTCSNPELADLPAQLLGRTLIVRDLAAARAIAAHTIGFRLVTLQGELLEPDGTLTVGTHHAETGILSRKSELRELRAQAEALGHRVAEAEQDLVLLRERIEATDARAASQQQEVEVLAEQHADLKGRVERHRDRRQGLHEEVEVSRDELQRIDQEVAGLEVSWKQAREQAAAAEARVHALQGRVEAAEQELRQREQQRQQRQQEHTGGKVGLAKAEERLAGLRARQARLDEDLRQRRQEQAQAGEALAGCKARLQESQRAMLQASASLASWYLDKESAERQAAELLAARDRDREERARLAAQAQAVRGEWQAEQERLRTHELAASELRHRRDTLSERLREDYQLDLAALYEERVASGQWPVASEETPDRAVESPEERTSSLATGHWPLATANEEIAELRKKLSRLGSVNLDSLQELTELEARAETLQAQFDDLTAAKRALEEIIGKINHDSRRLFAETFAAIRTHFQELFRKLFGGGMADIVLEDENDVLESGIEIIARPPGKELRSISLMSGGEKTMTAVALLMAIFRSKPSPFCILDEVDAALDEANIGRFTGVLREFLDRSQFILITHAKKTMACADVLYGITMQESGISKRVAVRFEDWPDDGVAAAAAAAEPGDNGGFGGK